MPLQKLYSLFTQKQKAKVQWAIFLSVLILALTAIFLLFLQQLANYRKQNELSVLAKLRRIHKCQQLELDTFGTFLCSTIGVLRFTQSADSPISSIESGLTFDQEVEVLRNPSDGYFFIIEVTTSKSNLPPTYKVYYLPKVTTGFFRSGNDSFFLDQTGIIRHSGSPTKIPDASSPPVE